MRPSCRRPSTPWLSFAFLLALSAPHPVLAQPTRPMGREAALALRFQELSFHPPRAEKRILTSGCPCSSWRTTASPW